MYVLINHITSSHERKFGWCGSHGGVPLRTHSEREANVRHAVISQLFTDMTLGSATVFMPRPCSLWAASSQWLGTAGVLEQNHFCPELDSSNGDPLPWATHQPGPHFLKVRLQSKAILIHSSCLPCLLSELSYLHCGLKALPVYSYALLPLFFTSISPNKSSASVILSWHLFLRGPELTWVA